MPVLKPAESSSERFEMNKILRLLSLVSRSAGICRKEIYLKVNMSMYSESY